MNKAIWIAVAISFAFLAVVILLSRPQPRAKKKKQQLIDYGARSAQETAGLAAEQVDLALRRHEEAWLLVEQGPQRDAQMKLAEADKYGRADIVRPQVLRELHSHPLYISARNATEALQDGSSGLSRSRRRRSSKRLKRSGRRGYGIDTRRRRLRRSRSRGQTLDDRSDAVPTPSRVAPRQGRTARLYKNGVNTATTKASARA